MDEQETIVEVSNETAELAAATMKGDIRDLVLDLFKNRQTSWQEMSEGLQREVVSNIEQAVGHAIDKAVRLIAADGRQAIVATLDSITVKDGFKAVCTMSKHNPFRHELVDVQGKDILIVVAGGDQYHGQKAEAEIEKDQPDLPLEGEDDTPVFDNTEAGQE